MKNDLQNIYEYFLDNFHKIYHLKWLYQEKHSIITFKLLAKKEEYICEFYTM